MRLPSENFTPKGENAFFERKRDNRVKPWLGKAKTPFQSDNIVRKGKNAFIERKRRFQRRKRFCQAKPSLSKAKMRLPSKNVSHKAKTCLPSKNLPRKGEIASTVRKCRSQRRKRVYRTKMWLPQAQMHLPSETVARRAKIRHRLDYRD